MKPREPDAALIGISPELRTHDEIRALRPAVPYAVPGVGGRVMGAQRCIACGVTAGVAKRPELIELEWMTLCVDYRACSNRVARDERTMVTLAGNA